jgi:hypothetical protein
MKNPKNPNIRYLTKIREGKIISYRVSPTTTRYTTQ